MKAGVGISAPVFSYGRVARMDGLVPKVGVGVLILKDGKVLMSERKASHGAGGYQFPGGHLEHLESFEECAKRETMEEAGIEIENVRFQFLSNVKTFAPKHYVHIGVTAQWKSGEPKHLEPEKNGPWQWYNLEELPQPLLLFAEQHFDSIKTGENYFDNVA